MTRHLEIIFYGMCCFESLRGGGYRVLFPDGRDMNHIGGVWVRQRKKTATARWPWITLGNDYFYGPPVELEVAGTKKTQLDTDRFDGRLVNLKVCDPSFEIANDPKVVATLLHVDRGTLSAHSINDLGQVVVKWKLDVAARAKAKIKFGKAWIQPSRDADQVVLANCKITSINTGKFEEFTGSFGSSKPESVSLGLGEEEDHFMIYRKLSTKPDDPLEIAAPEKTPQVGGAVVIDPDDYFHWDTPDVKCSPVVCC